MLRLLKTFTSSRTWNAAPGKLFNILTITMFSLRIYAAFYSLSSHATWKSYRSLCVWQMLLLQRIGTGMWWREWFPWRSNSTINSGHILQISVTLAANVQGPPKGWMGGKYELLRVLTWTTFPGPFSSINRPFSPFQFSKTEISGGTTARPHRRFRIRFHYTERRSSPLRNAERKSHTDRQWQRLRECEHRFFRHFGSIVSMLHVRCFRIAFGPFSTRKTISFDFRLRKSTWERLLFFSGGTLTELIDQISKMDESYPLLTPGHYKAVNRRMYLIFSAVEFCFQKYGHAAVLK